MNKLRTYPTYKDSGVEWIGDIPGHWQKIKCKQAFDIQLGKMLQPQPNNSNDQQVPYLKAQHVRWEQVTIDELPNMWSSKNDLNKYLVSNGDLLVCEGGEVGRAGVAYNVPEKCIIQNALHRVRSRNDNSVKLLMYILRTAATKEWFSIICNKATIAHFTGEKFAALSISLPPLDEQKQIAEYLDKKTGMIDELIEKKRQMIELLKEKRSATINQAVTKGLDQTVPMKDSGIDWFGDIPKHWEIMRLKDIGLGSLTNGVFKKKDQFGSGVKLVNVIDLYYGNNLINSNQLDRVEVTDSELSKFEVNNGDIFFVRSSLKREGIASSSLIEKVNEPTVFECHIVRFRPDPNTIIPKLLIYLLNSETVLSRFISISQTVTMTTISQEKISTIHLPVSSIDEQYHIVEYLDHKTAQIDTLITKTEQHIELLQERRTALINDAVTGKIDIRDN